MIGWKVSSYFHGEGGEGKGGGFVSLWRRMRMG